MGSLTLQQARAQASLEKARGDGVGGGLGAALAVVRACYQRGLLLCDDPSVIVITGISLPFSAGVLASAEVAACLARVLAGGAIFRQPSFQGGRTALSARAEAFSGQR